MSFKVKFTESDQTFNSRFGEVIQLDPPVILAKEITANGVYNASKDDASGYNPVTVNVDMTEAFNEGYNKATEENPFYYTYTLNSTFAAATFPENYDFVLRLKTQIGFYMPFQKARNIKSIKFIADDKTSIKRQAYNWFQWCYDVETIDLSEYGIVTLTGDCRSMFQECSKLKTVKGVLDFTDVTNWYNSAFNCKALEDIEFVANTIKISISFLQSSKLTKASLESIINGLNGDATGQTLTLSKTAVNNSFTDTEWEALKNTKSNWTINLS